MERLAARFVVIVLRVAAAERIELAHGIERIQLADEDARRDVPVVVGVGLPVGADDGAEGVAGRRWPGAAATCSCWSTRRRSLPRYAISSDVTSLAAHKMHAVKRSFAAHTHAGIRRLGLMLARRNKGI